MNALAPRALPLEGRDNNFQLIRLVLSICVIFAHSYAVLGPETAKLQEPFQRWLGIPLGSAAVCAFFALSGFLITRSYLSHRTVGHYLLARIRRIYPAYLAATLFSVLVVGSLFTTLPRAEYLRNRQTSAYLVHNAPLLFAGVLGSPASERWSGLPAKTVTGLEYTLPGVFARNPLARAVNIPIWTLPWELLMYLSVILVGALGLWARPRAVAAGTALVVAAFFANDYWAEGRHPEFSHLLQFLSFFYLGAVIQLFKHGLKPRYAPAVVFLLLTAACFHTAAFKYLFDLTMVYWLFLLAARPGGLIRRYNRLGDYSYGLYIYAFPVQQSLAALDPAMEPLVLCGLTLAITLPLAVVSWHCLERPVIDPKPV